MWLKPRPFVVPWFGRLSQYSVVAESDDKLFVLMQYNGLMPRSKFIVLFRTANVVIATDESASMPEWNYVTHVLPEMMASSCKNGDTEQWVTSHITSLCSISSNTYGSAGSSGGIGVGGNGTLVTAASEIMESFCLKESRDVGELHHSTDKAIQPNSTCTTTSTSANVDRHDLLLTSTDRSSGETDVNDTPSETQLRASSDPAPLRTSASSTVSSSSLSTASVNWRKQSGTDPDGPKCFRTFTLSNNEHYDLIVHSLSHMTPPSSAEIPWPKVRHCHTSAVWGSDPSMYIFGGYSNDCIYLNDFYKFTFSTAKWKKISSRGGPSPRHSHSAVVWEDDMYIFGGIDCGQQNNDTYCYSFVKKKWHKVVCKGDVPSRRWGHSAIVRKGIMFIFGGFGSSYMNDLYRLHLETFTWECVSTVGAVPTPRHFHSAILFQSSMIVISGFAGANSRTMHELNLITNVWTSVPLPVEFIPRRGHSAILCNINGAHFILVLGGRAKENPVGDLLAYDLGTKSWVLVCNESLQTARYFHIAAQSNDGTIWVFGGIGFSDSDFKSQKNLNDLAHISLEFVKTTLPPGSETSPSFNPQSTTSQPNTSSSTTTAQVHAPTPPIPSLLTSSQSFEKLSPTAPQADTASKLRDLKTKKQEELAAWLEKHNLSGYLNAFLDEEITLDTLPSLTEADLKELGVKMGARKQLQTAIAQLSSAAVSPNLGSDPSATIKSYLLKDIKIIRLIAHGGHGAVFEGLWQDTTRVAMKQIFSEGDQEFLTEYKMLCILRHPNCVFFYGIYDSSEGRFICTEYLPLGSLDVFLRGQGVNMTFNDLLDMALGTAAGMKYLSDQAVVHRDLAARNCLVSRDGEKYSTKVNDYGLSRVVTSNAYVSSNHVHFPYKWTAPEAADYATYTDKSDVWSFGVVLWEIFEFGIEPYPAMTNQQALTAIRAGYRMPIPRYLQQEPQNILGEAVYKLMLDCWHSEANKRPTFAVIYKTLYTIRQGPTSSAKPEPSVYDEEG
ncbi:Tyrosine-protein kinase Src42A [Pelomyxa schiedti]|nr:Tyrosine-protein kinase Src42A [Pelomyxa schiedti]